MLVPSLANSLAEQFNVFQVMHHGTHEKQLSNVFAWLLNADGTHELGDTFQRLFVEHVNRQLPSDGGLPLSGYRVTQEVDAARQDGLAKDISDIVLASENAGIVIENYEWSDGHGHSYERYLAHATSNGRQGVVVLLCVRHVHHLLRDGWEQAVVITYADLLESLRSHIARDRAWQHAHPRQNFFINELVQQYTEGPNVVSTQDQLSFLKAMCDTGESARYGHRPQEPAAQAFADVLAQHAKRQFEEGRKTLAAVKRSLRQYAATTLIQQLDGTLRGGSPIGIEATFSGQWEWCVALRREAPRPNILLEFGPSAVVKNGLAPEPLTGPDYGKIFVTRPTHGNFGIDLIRQTDVSLEEVLAGLSSDDLRLRDAVLAVAETDSLN